MLTRLEIQNFALIDQLELDWKPGLTVITGETGSGKSILLGALDLFWASEQIFKRQPEKNVWWKDTFISHRTSPAISRKRIWILKNTAFLRREILANGKSRAFVNDVPSTLEQLRNIADPSLIYILRTIPVYLQKAVINWSLLTSLADIQT
jgi:DNA repair protein RecN (Recombination protein N)